MKNLLIFFTFFISFLSFSQQQAFTKGEILKDRQFLIDNHEISVSDNNGNFVSVRPHRVNGTLRNYYVEFYKNLNFDKRIEVETQNFTKILKVFTLNNKLHVYVKETDKKNITIRVDLINLDTKVVIRKNLLEINKKEHPNIFNALKNENNLSINNSSNILLSFSVIEDKTIYTYLKSFDLNLNTLFNNKVYPNKNIHKKNISFLNISQNNKLIYILFSLFDEDDNKYYQLIELNNSYKRELLIPTDSDSYELINTIISKNNFNICGLYSKKKKGSFLGYTYYNIDLNSFELTSTKQSEFLTEKVKNYFTGFFKNNRSIDIRNVFIDENFNMYIVGQMYKVTKQYIPVGIPIASVTTGIGTFFITLNPISIEYKVFDDIFVSKTNRNGELIWDKILELRQTENIKSKPNKRDASYFTFFKNNQINILMNGYINIEKEKLVVNQNKRLNKTNFYNITVNPQGKITPNIIFSNTDSEIIFRAEKSNKTNTEVYILGQGSGLIFQCHRLAFFCAGETTAVYGYV